MGLIPIPNQPINIGTPLSQPCLNNDTTEYVTQIQEDDTMCLQWIQTPCSDELCEWTAGTEQLTNGTFTGSAAGWSLAAGWAYGTNNVVHSGGVSTLAQALVLGAGWYKWSYTVTSRGVNGQARMRVDGVFVGSGLSGLGTETGYFQGLVATNIDIRGTNSVTVDDVSFKSLFSCYTYTADWEINNEGFLEHITGNVTPLTTNTAPIASGTRYKVVVTVKGRSAGQLSVTVGGEVIDTITTNGSYTYYHTALGNGEVAFIPDTNFNGAIGNVQSSYMADDFECHIENQNGTNVTDFYTSASVSYPIIYEDEFCTWCFDVSELQLGGVAANIATGCYYVNVFHSCTSEEFESPLVNYKRLADADDCTVLLTATNGTGRKYGFYWGNFSLIQRLRMLRITPRYPAKGEDYFDSTGENFRIFGQSSKIYQAWFDYMDENAHDATRIQVLSNNIQITDQDGVNINYWCPVNDYEPEWIENNRRNLAQSRVDMSRKVDVLFGRNC